jgi:hypothetical protein
MYQVPNETERPDALAFNALELERLARWPLPASNTASLA